MRRRVILLVADVLILVLGLVTLAVRGGEAEPPPPAPVVEEDDEPDDPEGETGEEEPDEAETVAPVPEALERRGMGHPVDGDPREAAAGAINAIQSATGEPLDWTIREICDVGPEGQLVASGHWSLHASFFLTHDAVGPLGEQLGLAVQESDVGPTSRKGTPGGGGIVEIVGDESTQAVVGSIELPLSRPEAAPGVDRVLACGQPAR